jgi:hypothetical protein
VYRAAGVAVCAGCIAAALLPPGGATADPVTPQEDALVSVPTPPPVDPADPPGKPKGPIDVSEAPSIAGGDTAQVGATLTAQGGAWSGPHGTQARYEWWRCATPSPDATCTLVSDGTTQYRLGAADQSQYLFVVLYAWHGPQSAFAISPPSAPVAAPPAPTPVFEVTPPPDPAPVAPPPDPAPVTPPPAPVTSLGAVLKTSATDPKILQPFPVVRLAGRLTLTGARVTLFSVQAPLHVRITVACTGTGCPTRRWGRTTAGPLTRISAFERALPAGMRITVSVTRSGYIGKQTVFWIRRGKIPQRQDNCVYPNGKVRACPRG